MLERFELKYMIPMEMVEPISEFAGVYCLPDNYSEQSSSGFYRVNSLYIDSPGFLFLKMRIDDVPNRFNMRVRSYGDEPELPYYLEIKQKQGGIIKKFRASVMDETWYRAYTEPGFIGTPCDNVIEDVNRQLFERLVYTYNAAPKILTQYYRKALISEVDDYARITFDTALKFREETDFRPVPGEEPMVSYDHPMAFEPGCNVILELKCYTSSVPVWMIDLIRYFNLQRRSFSKYLAGATELMGLYSCDTGTRMSSFV